MSDPFSTKDLSKNYFKCLVLTLAFIQKSTTDSSHSSESSYVFFQNTLIMISSSWNSIRKYDFTFFWFYQLRVQPFYRGMYCPWIQSIHNHDVPFVFFHTLKNNQTMNLQVLQGSDQLHSNLLLGFVVSVCRFLCNLKNIDNNRKLN